MSGGLCDCQYRINGCCRLIADVTQQPLEKCSVKEDACAYCCKSDTPKLGEMNNVIASLSVGLMRKIDKRRAAELAKEFEPYFLTTGPTKPRPEVLAQRYAAAVSRWKAAGYPTRSVQEVAEIFEKHCKVCPRFSQRSGESGRCTVCGCNLRSSSRSAGRSFLGLLDTLTNKIRMATEHCPLGYW